MGSRGPKRGATKFEAVPIGAAFRCADDVLHIKIAQALAVCRADNEVITLAFREDERVTLTAAAFGSC